MVKNYTKSVIWGLAKCPELRLTDEELHLIVSCETGKDSIRSLNQGEINQVVRNLYERKSAILHQTKQKGNQITENQRKKIYKLMKDLDWNEARINGFCKSQYNVDRIEWMNYKQCSNMIEALKGMLSRAEKKERESNATTTC